MPKKTLAGRLRTLTENVDLLESIDEIEALDGAVAGTTAANKALILSSAQKTLIDLLFALTAAEIGYMDGAVAGSVVASKALVVDANKKSNSQILGGRLSSIVADGASFGGAGANVEQALGSGTITIPANTLAAGDVIRITGHVAIPTTVSTDTLRLYVKVGGTGGTAILDTTAIDVANDDFLTFDISIVFRTVGASGTALAVLISGYVLMGATDAPLSGVVTALSSQNTTGAITISVTGVWSTENANSCVLKQLNAVIN